MREQFIAKRLTKPSLELVDYCNEVIEVYMEEDLRLTLRQLYYQLVSANVIPNTERSYKRLGSLVSDARLAGLMDWDAIEDRIRKPVVWQQYGSISEAVEDTLSCYRLPRQLGQPHAVELWVEKDALAGVLQPIASEYHVTLMINRGYSSQSAMYEASKRIYRSMICNDTQTNQAIVLYLGDMDPSGEDMVRDIQARLDRFIPDPYEVQVRKLALTIEQVNEHCPPPNPAKLTDSRAAAFVEKHGYNSWEVDALPPRELRRIIESALNDYLDMDLIEAVKWQEREDKERLREAMKSLDDR